MPNDVSPLIVNPSLPSSQELRRISNDIADRVRLSLAAVATEGKPTAGGRLDKAVRAFVARQSPATRHLFIDRARALLDSPTLRAHHFGRFATVPLQKYAALGSDGMASHLGGLPFGPEGAEKVKTSILTTASGLVTGHNFPLKAKEDPIAWQVDPDFVDSLKFKKMRLFIRKVRCLEYTGGALEGSDEISMGGNFTTPNGSTTSLVHQFKVKEDFDPGELKDFGFSQPFATWDLQTEHSGFPYVYGAVISMAEKDDGGFYDFLKELWDIVNKEVTKAVTGILGAAIGAAIGGVLGGVIGFVAGALVGLIIAWVGTLLHNPDDIVGTNVVLMTLGASSKSYYDWAGLTSAEGSLSTIYFNWDGNYRVQIAYKVFTA